MKRPGFGPNMTAAQRQAQDAFKETLMVEPPSDEDIARKAFNENRERLKALRIARDATDKAKRND
jgi:hypothetical protein